MAQKSRKVEKFMYVIDLTNEGSSSDDKEL